MRITRRIHFAPRAVWCLAAAWALASAAQAQLPNEQITMEKLPPIDANRIYLSDPTMPHLVDGRTHVVDGNTLRYSGMLGTGFAGLTGLSRDGKTLYVATTYHSRLQRGTRTDVVEVYRADDLVFQHEIEIPPKHVQGLAMRALIATSADDRFLLVQNATPATSVTVVDVQARRAAGEIATPGCYGVLPWPAQPHRFSSVCGDGTLATYSLDEKGASAASKSSEPFFNPDKDPVFMHYQWVDKQLLMVSYLGDVYTMTLDGEQPAFSKPWPMVDAAARRQGWRPGGYQLFAVDPKGERLYVGMHDKGTEGSHKTPAKEIWVFDLKTQKRLARIPGQAAVSMAIGRSDKPRLFVLSGADNRILSYDVAGARPPAKPSARSEPVGETPVYLGMQ